MAGAGIAFAGLLGFGTSKAHARLGSDVFLAYLLVFALATCSLWLWRTGKRLRSRTAEEIQNEDSRPPVLYLRSFGSDSQADRSVQGHVIANPFTPGMVLKETQTEEEQIAEVMSELGPMVAIGRPGEVLPQLGAARMYTSDDEWQAAVRNVLWRSQIVLMRTGETAGFWWEVATSTASIPLEKIVFLLPTSPQAYERFRSRAQPYFARPLPTDYDPDAMTDRSFGGILWFDADGTAHLALCPLRRTFMNQYRKAVAGDLRDMLDPVFRRLGVRRLVPATRMHRLAASMLDLAIAVLLFVLLILISGTLPLEEQLIGAVVCFLIVLYLMIGLEATKLRATPGKLLTRLVTADKTGVRLSLLQSGLRFIVKLTVGFPYSFVLLLLGKPTLHDIAARSVVLRKLPKGD